MDRALTMTRRWSCIFVCLGLIPITTHAMQQAFLVQNSGWMEPFFADQKSALKPLVVATIDVASGLGDSITVLAFNQSTPENPSPMLMFSGAPGNDARSAVSRIEMARKGAGKALADTDFNEAVFKTITGPFKSSPGILWIFTNNKNSPNNSTETSERNRDFYRLVHSEPAITRSLAFPLAMPVKGRNYSASGLMVYVLAYGAEADTYLQALVTSGRLKKVFSQQPAQLKPLDRESIRLVPKSVLNAPNTTALLGADGRTLFLDIDVSEHQPVVQMVAAMENMFYPYRIGSANISAQLVGQGWENELPVAPDRLASVTSATLQGVCKPNVTRTMRQK